MQANVLSELETALGYGFANPELLLRALDAPIAGQRTNSRGDRRTTGARATTSGWSFWATRCWAWWWPKPCFCFIRNGSEGELTRVRAQLVSRQHMAEVAGIAGTGPPPAPEPRRGPQRPAPQEHRALEHHGGRDRCVVPRRRPGAGASVCPPARDGRDGGATGAGACDPERRWATTNRPYRSICRRSDAGTPVYKVKSESGPDHRKRFLVEVRLKAAGGEPGKSLARGLGSTKKHAEQDAARRALARLTAGVDGNEIETDDTMKVLRPTDGKPSAGRRKSRTRSQVRARIRRSRRRMSTPVQIAAPKPGSDSGGQLSCESGSSADP